MGIFDCLRLWNAVAAVITPPKHNFKRFFTRVLDIDGLDLAMGKIMDQGPVLVITFNSQQILCVKDRGGKVIEGSDEKVMRVTYVWVMCRDQTELNPRAAWRLLDLSAQSQEQYM